MPDMKKGHSIVKTIINPQKVFPEISNSYIFTRKIKIMGNVKKYKTIFKIVKKYFLIPILMVLKKFLIINCTSLKEFKTSTVT